MPNAMTKAERQELRVVIRARMKVLRADVAARVAEMDEELEEQIEAKYHEEDARRAALLDQVQHAIAAAEREVTDLLKDEPVGVSVHRPVRLGVAWPHTGIRWPDDGRDIMRRNGRATLEERRRKALLAIDRQEADLLQALAVDALESEAATRFLGSIPQVGELVPAFRLAELEAGLGDLT